VASGINAMQCNLGSVGVRLKNKHNFVDCNARVVVSPLPYQHRLNLHFQRFSLSLLAFLLAFLSRHSAGSRQEATKYKYKYRHIVVEIWECIRHSSGNRKHFELLRISLLLIAVLTTLDGFVFTFTPQPVIILPHTRTLTH